MTSEWDHTPWAGTAVAETLPVPHDGMAVPVKAATGWQSFYNGVNQPLASLSRTPQKMMKEAQGLYWRHRWIRSAENAVTRRVAGLPRHIEDGNDDTVDDETQPALQVVRDLIEKPQAALPPNERQPGLATGRNLISLISRHTGLCGISYIHPDQVDANGLPLALLYVNPARVWPKTTANGNLIGYAVDADDYGNGGIPFRPDELIAFYLEPPDWGTNVMGLVGALGLTSGITTAGDLYTLSVLTTGGRIAGLVSPKDGYVDNEGQFAQMERDFRNVNEAPDAAKRMTIIRGAVDFNKTAADPSQLMLKELTQSSRDDTFITWGVPPSQAGVPESRGLNSGEAGKHEYEVLMTGPVHDRVVAITETFQFELLDRWQATGIGPQLVIEEPSFDDEGPAYEVAAKARELPLTNNERRAQIGKDPLPDYGPDGDPLGVAIWLPATITFIAQGPEGGSSPDNPFPNAPKPPPPPPMVASAVPVPQLGSGIPSPVPAAVPAKAGFLGLRKGVDARVVPAIRRALAAFLASQRKDIAERLRGASERQLKDEAYWFRGDYWDRQLGKTLKPHVAGIAETVTTRTADIFTAKAKPTKNEIAAQVEAIDIDPFTERVARYVAEQTGLRIGGINETTRTAVADVIRAGIGEGLTAQDIASRIEELPAFDEARAELVARTESMFAYNTAAISSYREYGVQEVQAIDGDQDEACAERNGRTFSIEEADGIEDHPNGTLDWVPIFAKADPMIAVAKAVIELAQRPQVAPVVNVAAPKVNVTTPAVNVEPAQITVNVPSPRPVKRTILREDGKITGSLEEAV